MPVTLRAQLLFAGVRLGSCPLQMAISTMSKALNDDVGWARSDFSAPEYISAACLACAYSNQWDLSQSIVLDQQRRSTQLENNGSHMALVAATILGDMATVELLCTQGVDFNKSSLYFGYPLYVAIRHGSPRMIQRLLELGATLEYNALDDGQPQRSPSPWTAAAACGNLEVFTFIRNRLRTWNDSRICESLIVACEGGHMSIIKKCFDELQNIASLTRNYWFTRPFPVSNMLIGVASKNGHVDVLNLLANYGIRYDNLPTYPNHLRCYEPFMRAVEAGQISVVRYFISTGLSAESSWGRGAIAMAARRGQIETASILLEAGFSLTACGPALRHESRGPWTRNPVINASWEGEAAMLRWLIDKGRSLSQHYGGHYCLQLAALRGHEEVVSVLLEHGVNPNSEAAWALYPPPKHLPSYWPPIVIAQMYEDKKGMYELLLKYGAIPIDPAKSDLAESFMSGSYPIKFCQSVYAM
ncbi:ankyrin [Microthyrium microscopicum]|uniref:Ankyrin n=1 Tax=Microthyrium microscopicum TaxID=703497 RepID=A0A6A6UPN6_9PEZI|nr:ankyrin [Microthyrium microscopicum]